MHVRACVGARERRSVGTSVDASECASERACVRASVRACLWVHTSERVNVSNERGMQVCYGRSLDGHTSRR